MPKLTAAEHIRVYRVRQAALVALCRVLASCPPGAVLRHSHVLDAMTREAGLSRADRSEVGAVLIEAAAHLGITVSPRDRTSATTTAPRRTVTVGYTVIPVEPSEELVAAVHRHYGVPEDIPAAGVTATETTRPAARSAWATCIYCGSEREVPVAARQVNALCPPCAERRAVKRGARRGRAPAN